MGVWELTVYDRNWKIISRDYKECSDRQQAELRAEADCDWLGGAHWEVRRIRQHNPIMSTRHGGYDGLEVKIMEKMTIPQKRASVYREWILSKLGNDERYYMSTLYTGIPDGDDLETALADLADGLYDDDLDDMIDLYRSAKKAYGKSGYYVKKQLIFNEDEALTAAGYSIPDRIYMKH